MERMVRSVLASAGAAGEPVGSADAWWRRHVGAREGFERSMDRAIVAGAAMDRVGWAFASGYACALGALDPGLDASRPASLLATERDGGHPRAIRTVLERGPDGALRLTGRKRFATLAPCAGTLLVVASEGDDASSGRNRLRVVRVARDAPGVTLAALPPTPFAPEVPHAEVALEGVSVALDAVLEGDGYSRWLKPFRTVEDCHVHGALLGFLAASARAFGFPREACERLLALCALARALGDAGEPDGAGVHLALAGLLSLSREAIAAIEPHWSLPSVPAEARDRFARDAGLFGVAAGVRAQRTERAWERVAEG